jgi:magnesium transporter
MLGIVTVDDVIDVLVSEGTEDVLRFAGIEGGTELDQPYFSVSLLRVVRRRVGWLLLLFLAETFTGSVLRLFESELARVVALSFFIPLLIGTGGNSGTQITSTLVRAMALGEVSLRNLGAVIRKEVTTSLLIAVTIGLAAWVRAWIMGVGMEVTLVVSLSLVAITVWSAIVSSIIPMLLKRLGIDPAVVSAPFIATFIDGTGLIIYFKIAQHVLGI